MMTARSFVSLLAIVLVLPIRAATPPVDLDTESPYYPGRNYPKLTTPQWVGEEGVEAVVILAIDDMRDHRRYETFLRPILERLKKIDGRAPVSIMTNQIQPGTPLLQQWLKEGLAIDAHTADHPCPILAGNDFGRAKSTYDRCVDQLFAIRNNVPVAFRTPCCDSLNTFSPRLLYEIIAKRSAEGRFLTIDSSVFNVTTANDAELPRELVLQPDGRERFRKYVPFESFVNTIEDYPYPYVVGRVCWEFPCATPSDWQAQFVHKANASPTTTADWKAQLDATVIKRGVMTMVFHPHGWSTPEQFVELIDHATAKYGKRVKFLNFREAEERLTKNVTGGTGLRKADGSDAGVRLVDVNGDGYLDVLADGAARVWDAAGRKWATAAYPEDLRAAESLANDGRSYVVDIDRDRRPELIVGGHVFRWDANGKQWAKLGFNVPDGVSLHDGGALVDVDEDGLADLVYSDETRSCVYLFAGWEKGWTRKVHDVARPDPAALPPIVRGDGSNNGMWVHSRTLWWQNEDTAKLPNLVDRRSFNDLLKEVQPTARSPRASLESMRVAPGYKVELVAAEPLVQDPVAMAFGPDGRLWVVEMGDYPRGVDGRGKPGGRVRYLEDADGDGAFEKSTLFLEGVPFPTSVLPWKKGVLVTAAPDIFYAEDTDGDGKADRREMLFTGFREGNQQHRVNHLSFGLDNWVYGANGDSGGTVRSLKTGKSVSISGRDFRFRPETGEFEAVTGQTQFGRTRTDAGDWFGCNNVNPLYHFALDEHYLRRNPHVPASPGMLRVDVPAIPGSSPVYPISRLLTRFNDFHTANHFTSACGTHVYRDDLLVPASAESFQVFTSEPVHNLVHREVVRADGATFRGTRAGTEEKSEFLASSDNWFRPTTLVTGPDGALYVADMYRHVIEHPEWIPKEWQDRLDLRAGHQMGRIYRVVPVGATRRAISRLDRLDDAGLVAALDSVNGWQRDLAQWMLVWRQSAAAVPMLEECVRTAKNPLARLHALCALEGLTAGKGPRAEVLVAALGDASPVVRRHAVRVAEGRMAELADVRRAAGRLVEDPDAQVRMQVAYSLGEWRDAAAGELLGRLATGPAADRFLASAVASSLNGQNILSVATTVARGAGGSAPSPALLADVSRTAVGTKNPQAIAAMLQAPTAKAEGGGGYGAPQLRTLATLLDALDESNNSLAKLAQAEPTTMGAAAESANEAVRWARRVVSDGAASADVRGAAVALLGREPATRKEDLAVLEGLLSPQAPRELQAAVIAAAGRRREVEFANLLIRHWKGLTPELRNAALDALLARADRAKLLLDAVESKAVLSTEIDAARRQRLLQSSDKGVGARAGQVLKNLTNPDRERVIAAYSAAATLPGDTKRGRVVFTNACATCHRLGELGKAVGPDLAAVGDKSPQGLLVAILDPNRAVEPRYVNYIATTADDETHTGLLAAESATSITLMGPDGQQETLRRADLKDLRSSNSSLMPEGLEANLKPQDLADLMAFVRAPG